MRSQRERRGPLESCKIKKQTRYLVRVVLRAVYPVIDTLQAQYFFCLSLLNTMHHLVWTMTLQEHLRLLCNLGMPGRYEALQCLAHQRRREQQMGRLFSNLSLMIQRTVSSSPMSNAITETSDPLNWSAIRRDVALVTLGFYCMVGGGMTPILAAAFPNVAETYNVSVPRVALTTGLYMMGLGVGGVIASPTAIAFGKRPVYLVAAVIFLLTSVWCALSPNYPSLVVARVIMGISVSPVECLPSATIAEIFFLHERAYRLGIYTLLLLGGKNIIPLVSAAITQSLGWRWVFWVTAMVVGFCAVTLFLFVPETFWDRTPTGYHRYHRPSLSGLRRLTSHRSINASNEVSPTTTADGTGRIFSPTQVSIDGVIAKRRKDKHARFSGDTENQNDSNAEALEQNAVMERAHSSSDPQESSNSVSRQQSRSVQAVEPEMGEPDHFGRRISNSTIGSDPEGGRREAANHLPPIAEVASPMNYTKYWKDDPNPKSFVQALKPYNGRLTRDNWFRVAARPFILFAYPSILWSATVYALSVGWLIVLSESVSTIYRNKESYNFSAIGTGLVYISPFIGGILGTVVAGKLSDIIVRYISRYNDGVYEPEFRLVMAIPVALATTIGLMGFGWAAEERDAWIVPTMFFGIISFGCTLGSTTSITFAVDSYRQYAGEALVTLNFSKNIFHGLVFSLFFNSWLDSDGSKRVFLALGGIQLGFLLFTIPMYIFGKRARMWTVRRNLMEKF